MAGVAMEKDVPAVNEVSDLETNDLGHGWYSNSKYGYFQKLGVSMIIPAY